MQIRIPKSLLCLLTGTAIAPDELDVLSNLGLSQALAMDLDGAIETLRQVDTSKNSNLLAA